MRHMHRTSAVCVEYAQSCAQFHKMPFKNTEHKCIPHLSKLSLRLKENFSQLNPRNAPNQRKVLSSLSSPILANSRQCSKQQGFIEGFQTFSACPHTGTLTVILTGKPEVLGHNPVSGSLCPLEITRGLAPDVRPSHDSARNSSFTHMKAPLISFRTQQTLNIPNVKTGWCTLLG